MNTMHRLYNQGVKITGMSETAVKEEHQTSPLVLISVLAGGFIVGGVIGAKVAKPHTGVGALIGALFGGPVIGGIGMGLYLRGQK